MTDPVATVFTSGITGFQATLLLVAGSAIVVGFVVLALKRGWGFVKTFTK